MTKWRPGDGPNPKLSAARKRSWETRRLRYGARGSSRRSFRVKHSKDAAPSKGSAA